MATAQTMDQGKQTVDRQRRDRRAKIAGWFAISGLRWRLADLRAKSEELRASAACSPEAARVRLAGASGLAAIRAGLAGEWRSRVERSGGGGSAHRHTETHTEIHTATHRDTHLHTEGTGSVRASAWSASNK